MYKLAAQRPCALVTRPVIYSSDLPGHVHCLALFGQEIFTLVTRQTICTFEFEAGLLSLSSSLQEATFPVYGHVCRHVPRHLSRHAYSNVCRHVYRHTHQDADMRIDMRVDICADIYAAMHTEM